MPTLLRQLRKRFKWSTDEPLEWLQAGDVPADPLNNLATDENRLSVYEVTGDQTQIGRIAAAIAAGSTNDKPKPEEFEYILFDHAILSELAIRLDPQPGETCDAEVNALHRDLIELSASKLALLANRLVPTTEPQMLLGKEILGVLVEAVGSGRIPADRIMSKKLREKLQQTLEERRH